MIVINPKEALLQPILDFDYLAGREPSIKAAVGRRKGFLRLFYGSKEVAIPIYDSPEEALERHTSQIALNLSSYRSAYESSLPFLGQVETLVVVAEGVPVVEAASLIKDGRRKGTKVLGPASIGFLEGGVRKAGLAGGDGANIVKSKLYAKGHWGIITKSGGLLNELMHIVSSYGGTAKAVALGGDYVTGSSFVEEMVEMQDSVGAFLLLGEVGGREELEVAKAIERGEIRKPVVAHVYGKAASLFQDVSFGHAAAMVEREEDKAEYKMAVLREAGAIVVDSFSQLPKAVDKMAKELSFSFSPPAPRPLPMDWKEAERKGIVRRKRSILSSISRPIEGEIHYRGVKATEVPSVGAAISLLWFGRRAPLLEELVEKALILLADHGPAVSGAHNAIVTARAGKGIIESLAAGLLTIGPRFGGALDSAAKVFMEAVEEGKEPWEVVEAFKAKKAYIPGYGHRVKSKENPDERVKALLSWARERGVVGRYTAFALALEEELLRKNPKLIFNVDGALAALLLDVLEREGFSSQERKALVEAGAFNALFALARSIGMIGHALDQKLLGEGLYRHDEDDILYL